MSIIPPTSPGTGREDTGDIALELFRPIGHVDAVRGVCGVNVSRRTGTSLSIGVLLLSSFSVQGESGLLPTFGKQGGDGHDDEEPAEAGEETS